MRGSSYMSHSNNRLFYKIEGVGIMILIVKIIKNYIENRRKYVKIETGISPSLQIKSKVSQGTVL